MVRGILKTEFIILKGALWNIGDERSVKFWNGPWLIINDKHTRLCTLFPDEVDNHTKVSFYLNDSETWIFAHSFDMLHSSSAS